MLFPVVLKPNMGGGGSRFSQAKVVRADDRAAFLSAYADAAGQIGIGNVVVQQLIPGGGECQFSYAALWHEGEPVAEFTARRTRQNPVEFGYTSTIVEVQEVPDAVEAARLCCAPSPSRAGGDRVQARTPRDGELRVLDVKPRSEGRGSGSPPPPASTSAP